MKQLLIALLATLALGLQAGEFTMPDKATLESRLAKIGMSHFDKKTNVSGKLAGRTLLPLGIPVAIECALYDYDKHIQNPLVRIQMQILKPMIYTALLQDNPAALEKLKSNGMID